MRVIGDTIDRYRPQAVEIDGGRPRVRSQRPAKEEAQGLDPGGILENDKRVSRARSASSRRARRCAGHRGVGPCDRRRSAGHRVRRHADPAPFLAQLKSRSKEPQHPLSSPLETSPVSSPKTPAKPSPSPTLELEVFIAPQRPVRARQVHLRRGRHDHCRAGRHAGDQHPRARHAAAGRADDRRSAAQTDRTTACRARTRAGAARLPPPAWQASGQVRAVYASRSLRRAGRERSQASRSRAKNKQ